MTRNHIKYLQDKGIVVNHHQKTELIYFSNKQHPQIKLRVGTSTFKSQSTIKALGITIDKDLKWTQHVNDVVKKVTSLSSGL